MKEALFLLIISLIISNSLCGYDYSDLEDDCSEFSSYKLDFCETLEAEDDNKKCTYVNNECISCGVCKKVCPSSNIVQEPNNKPICTNHF